ncbi:cytosolic carboxypeptidase-like protein 5 isoform X2 [Centruroides vittatus]|uniref:cytosolic carboxypeptidase-like protein 5 isoform X2 n=1 Tax=Centruroides vittatus TaxID=120091 RepID=UPI00350EE3D9
MRTVCGGLVFTSDFESGNLARVELVSRNGKNYGTTNAENTTEDTCKLNNLCPFQSVGDAFCIRGNIASSCTQTKPEYDNGRPKKPGQPMEFNIWLHADCAGTPYENTNRTWFHFGIQGGYPETLIKINIVNMNRQIKLFGYGMTPVYRIVPGKERWNRIPRKPIIQGVEDNNFILTFCHKLPSDSNATIYFAFTFPFTYSECQDMLNTIDKNYLSGAYKTENSEDDIYYYRELVCNSLDGHRIDLLTITSQHGKTDELESTLPHLFLDSSQPRCHKFVGKRVIFISSRVHPGETPSSFVFNGILQFLLSPSDIRAITLRRLFVFKLIPMLNPDGVVRGHYRTDSRGVNLNRVYLGASILLHPSIYASRALFLYYHKLYAVNGSEGSSSLSSPNSDSSNSDPGIKNNLKKPLQMTEKLRQLGRKFKICDNSKREFTGKEHNINNIIDINDVINIRNSSNKNTNEEKDSIMASAEELTQNKIKSDDFRNGKVNGKIKESNTCHEIGRYTETGIAKSEYSNNNLKSASGNESNNDISCGTDTYKFEISTSEEELTVDKKDIPVLPPEKSGIAYYIDLHGHASKRGCFFYGNYFGELDKKTESWTLAKLMSINCPNFDYSACNFSSHNMWTSGRREGQSKKGSGRVAFYLLTGIIHSYTLECNYNTGRSINNLAKIEGSDGILTPPLPGKAIPYYSPTVYQQVGRALAVSILDATGHNPVSRLNGTSYKTMNGIRNWVYNDLESDKAQKKQAKDNKSYSWSMGYNDSNAVSSIRNEPLNYKRNDLKKFQVQRNLEISRKKPRTKLSNSINSTSPSRNYRQILKEQRKIRKENVSKGNFQHYNIENKPKETEVNISFNNGIISEMTTEFHKNNNSEQKNNSSTSNPALLQSSPSQKKLEFLQKHWENINKHNSSPITKCTLIPTLNILSLFTERKIPFRSEFSGKDKNHKISVSEEGKCKVCMSNENLSENEPPFKVELQPSKSKQSSGANCVVEKEEIYYRIKDFNVPVQRTMLSGCKSPICTPASIQEKSKPLPHISQSTSRICSDPTNSVNTNICTVELPQLSNSNSEVMLHKPFVKSKEISE